MPYSYVLKYGDFTNNFHISSLTTFIFCHWYKHHPQISEIRPPALVNAPNLFFTIFLNTPGGVYYDVYGKGWFIITDIFGSVQIVRFFLPPSPLSKAYIKIFQIFALIFYMYNTQW